MPSTRSDLSDRRTQLVDRIDECAAGANQAANGEYSSEAQQPGNQQPVAPRRFQRER
jgi:hypothetical protein